ncbi:MAG: sulfotransferase family protein [Chloroflexota bacterium]
MSIRVVGAGVGRTGTSSLRQALEILLGKPCYHMRELLDNPDHISFWHEAAFGGRPDWQTALADYGAGVDWPFAAFWPELSTVYPDALIILSKRPADQWWESASKTIYAPRERPPGMQTDTMLQLSRTRFPIHPIIHDREKSMALFEKWNKSVIAQAPADRLLVWEARDGWQPICQALRLPVPEIPFPHRNTRQEFIDNILKRDSE